jgi:hypothetical protein
MSKPAAHPSELEARLAGLWQERYAEAADIADACARAEQRADAEFLALRVQCLEAALADGAREVAWMAPGVRSAPAQVLRRVKALCAQHDSLFPALFIIAATHPGTPREMLVKAIKQFRRDADAFSESDLTSLLVSAGNGGLQGFEAVLRTRKNAARKASTLPWGGSAE